jgi:serine/threonine protein kinase
MFGIESYLSRDAMTLSKYRLLGLVGQGQFGRVYCAVDRKKGRLVALKELDPNRFPTKQFLRELRFLLSLSHPNIVTCRALEHGKHGRCLVMDYCEGGTLRSLMETAGQLHPSHALSLVTDVLQGLEYAHNQGIIHCDIKPENILLGLQPSGWVAHVTDFGVARLVQELGDSSSGHTGSPAYMAPERFYGQYSYGSDLYAVGVLLFELLTGYRPFTGMPGELMSAHLNQLVEIPETVPFLMRSILSTALQKLPHRRFASASEMLKAVRLAAEVETTASQGNSLLVTPTVNWAACPFQAVRQQRLTLPITRLAVTTNQVWTAEITRVTCDTYEASALDSEPIAHWQTTLPHPVAQFHPLSTGCLTLTQSHRLPEINHTLYQIAGSSNQDSSGLRTIEQDIAALNLQALAHPTAYTLFSICRPKLLMAVDPAAKWVAMMSVPKVASETKGLEQTKNSEHLTFLKLSALAADAITSKPAVAISELEIAEASALISLNRRLCLAIASHSDAATPRKTLLQVINRRGKLVGTLSLPMGLRQVTRSARSDFELFAIEEHKSPCGLLINLKPWKVVRVPLAIDPNFVQATSWGYILADFRGQVLLLSDCGEQIGGFQVPMTITAIAAVEPYGLLVATWDSTDGILYTIDLKALNLDFIF